MNIVLDQKKNRIKNLIIDFVYIISLLLLAYICYKLFGWMLINYNKQYRSDIPAYVMILEERPDSNLRLIYVIFRFLLNLTDSELGIHVFLTLMIVLICLVNYYYICYYSDCDTTQSLQRFAVSAFSIAVIFAGPIYLPGIHPFFYKNTLPTFAWHSPTQHLLTFFSVLATLSLFRLMDRYKECVSIPWWFAAAILFFMSAWSKPSYIIIIAPAIVIVFLIELLIKNELPFGKRFIRLFIIGLSLVPSGLYIIKLYNHVYHGESESGVVVGMTASAEGPPLYIALICSFLFSLIVMLFNCRKIFTDRRFMLIILLSVVGLLEMLFLGESGWRSEHGNFSWGCMIGGYMLMLTCLAQFINNFSDKNFLENKKPLKGVYYLIACGALALHLLSNIYYFIGMYNGAGFYR